jgi:hypothetical protein
LILENDVFGQISKKRTDTRMLDASRTPRILSVGFVVARMTA